MKLPKNPHQEWHQIILGTMVDNKDMLYSELTELGYPMRRLDDLREWGMFEKTGELDNGKAGVNPDILNVTTKGYKYWCALLVDFELNYWGRYDMFADLFDFYALSGDVRCLFPIILEGFKTNDFSTEEKCQLAQKCLEQNNGYLFILAQLYLSYGESCLHWFDKKHSPLLRWGKDESESKAINLRLSQVGYDALLRVVGKMETKELRASEGVGSKVGGEGFAVELGIIVLASLLESLF